MTKTFGGFPGARHYDERERQILDEVARSQSPYRFYGLALSRQASQLEGRLAKEFLRQHALVVSSGTAALHTALAALEIGPGDEVILPSYGWAADLMAVLAVGATPVIAPITVDLGLDPKRLEECISDRTKAIIAIHMRGQPCQIAAIEENFPEIPIVEDGAQCMGGVAEKRKIGQTGKVSIFSFQYHKYLTSGEGGVVLTNDPELHRRARCFHDMGMLREEDHGDPSGIDAIESFGLNYRMTEFQAGLLRVQVEKIDRIFQALRNRYQEALDLLTPICADFHLSEVPLSKGSTPNYAVLALQSDHPEEAQRAMRFLHEKGIPAQACGNLDLHHADVWENFLKRKKISYRAIGTSHSREILNRTLFIEINSAIKNAGEFSGHS